LTQQPWLSEYASSKQAVGSIEIFVGRLKMHSCQHQTSSFFYDPKRRLTTEEWALIMDALRAYQHNEAYRALYKKLGKSPLQGEVVPSKRNFDKVAS
jgi:molybdopterin synthase catalytic subunit